MFAARQAFFAPSGGQLVTQGLTLYLDAANTSSYPGSGTVWYDLSGNGYNFDITSTAWTNAGSASYMDFAGGKGCAKRRVGGVLSDVPNFNPATVMVFSTILASTSNWRTMLRAANAVGNHQIIVQQGSNNLGMYDNLPASGLGQFIGTGFNVTSIPNYNTQFNCLIWDLQQSSPYYSFRYNLNTTTYNITNINASFLDGFAVIGAWQNNSADPAVAQQFWGRMAVVLYYNRKLTQEEVTQNYNFFKDRYGL